MGIYSCPHCEEVFEIDAGTDDVVFCPHCNEAVSLPEEEEISPGSRLGGFEIIRLIGRGGMGNVYLASQISMHREVALKVLPKKITQDKAAVEQFLQEVRMTGRMEHSNIVTAIDAGEHNGIYYLAMTYVNGYDLETVIDKGGPIQENEAIAYIIQIAEALRYAWDKHNLLHRDIKPGNIMITGEGKAFLLDMGIALHATDASKQQNEQVEGSPFYMSPEQTRGEPLDWSSDLYSMGASLYHMITGAPPFDGEDIEKIVMMHSSEPFPDPREKKPELNISPEVASLLRRMMGKRPHDRFSSWKNFIKAAEPLSHRDEKKKIVIGEMQLQTTETEIVKKEKSILKSKWTYALGAAILLALFCGMTLYMVKYLNTRKANNALVAAEAYQSTQNYDCGKAVGLFRQAEAASNRTFVSENIKELTKSKLKNAINILEKSDKDKAAAERLSDKIAQLFSEANKLAKEADSTKNKDEKINYLDEALEKCTEAFSIITTINAASISMKDLLKSFTEKFEALDKALKKKKADFLRKDSMDKAALAAKEKAAKQQSEHQKEETKTLEQQQETTPAKQATESISAIISKEKNRIRAALVICLKEKDFEKFRKSISDIDGTIKTEKEAEENFQTWLNEMKFYAKTTEDVWLSLCKSGTLYAKVKLKFPFAQEAEVVKIENNEMFFKTPLQYKVDDKIRVANKLLLKHIDTRHIIPIIKKACDDSGNGEAFFSYMLCSGEFAIARKAKHDEKQKAELSEIIYAYLKTCLTADGEAANYSKTNKKFEDLKERYESLPEYAKVLEDLKKGADNKN